MSAFPQAIRPVTASEPERYVCSQAVVSRRIGGETLVVPIRGKVGDLASIYSFNESGSLLWSALQQPRSLDQLVHLLRQSYEVTWEDARRDADTFVAEMQIAGLVAKLQP